METKSIITYSSLRTFRNCRKKYYWRNIRELVPLERRDTLFFGSLIHECLAAYHGGASWEAVMNLVDAAETVDHDMWIRAGAMMGAYRLAYPQGSEWFKVMGVEMMFKQSIINPETMRASRSFDLAGVVDGVVERDGELWLIEHKTAAKIDREYLDRLWTDTQIILYSAAVEEMYQRPVRGIIYNILTKVKLQQGKGETEQEYKERKAALAAGNKSGISNAKRHIAETDKEFSARLEVKYSEPGMFHREEIILDRVRYDELSAELWELTKALLDARLRGVYYCNTDQCNHWNSMCPYFQLCSARNPELLIANNFRIEPAHSELKEATSCA